MQLAEKSQAETKKRNFILNFTSFTSNIEGVTLENKALCLTIMEQNVAFYSFSRSRTLSFALRLRSSSRAA